ncbi:TPA: AAC(3) family N-acetyltransferase [Vibrio vulnificus]|nr:AAC(3) family N-acetyltransferase [Vibrio vulnificus]
MCKRSETISDAISRHKYKLLSRFNLKTYTLDDIEKILRDAGINEGDCIMLHASWRAFSGFESSPEELILLLLRIIGDDGTLLMPCNGSHKDNFFDVKNSPNYSGVISQVFMKMEGVKRSVGGHFSVCAYGKLRDELLDEHINSIYGFDDSSPYGKFSQLESKVLFMGLGKKPTKISLFHRVGYVLRKEEYFKSIFSEHKKVLVIDENNNSVEKSILNRVGFKNCSKNIRKIFDSIPASSRFYSKIGLLDIVLLDTQESLRTAFLCAKNGVYMYKKK